MKSLLYAPRVKGDLDLGLEASRIDPRGDRRWAEIITPGGRLPGRPKQDILVQSATPNYRLGTRRVMDDRVFRYCHATEEIGSCKAAYCDAQEYWEGNGDIPAADVLATTVVFDNKAAEPIIAHALADGWIAGIATTGDAHSMFCMRIKDNEVSAGVGGTPATCTIYLYRPIPVAWDGINHRGYVYPNIYANVKASGGATYNTNYGAVVAVPLVKVLGATPYFWGLTWGIFYGQCGHWAANVGATVNKRIFHFDGVGGMIYHGTPGSLEDAFFQKGGYLMMDGLANQWGAIAGGDQLAMLQLSP